MEGLEIDLDAVWRELGYASKQLALKQLNEYKDGFGYRLGETERTKGRPRKKVYLDREAYNYLKRNSRVGALRRELIERLRQQFGGEEELKTQSSVVVDLITEECVYLIELEGDWVRALGRFDLINDEFPNHRRILYLYKPTPHELALAKKFLSAGIDVFDFSNIPKVKEWVFK